MDDTSPFDVRGRTILITGASSGFGRHFALFFARQGAKLILAARRVEALEETAAQIVRTGGDASVLPLDVSKPNDVTAKIEALPVLDVVINNAGMSGHSRAIDCPPEEWRRTFDVNVQGVFDVSRASARRMRDLARPGAIVNIASITGFRPGASAAAYSTSKAAVIHMTKALAMEWARFGVRVNAIAPGYFETDLSRDFMRSSFGEDMRKRIPQRRYGELHELDGAILLLASDASSYMTGSVIAVDGGHLVSVL